MNRLEYLRGLEHRERLARMVDKARDNMTAGGFFAFARGIEHQMSQLEAELAEYESSESARFCRWIGMKVYTVSTGPLAEPSQARIADLEVSLGCPEACGELALSPA